jgi:hypothetical protein
VAGNVIGPPSDEFGKGRLRIEALGESGQAGVILRRVDAAITAVPRPALASSPSAWRPCRPADATGRPRRRGVRSKYGHPWGRWRRWTGIRIASRFPSVWDQTRPERVD